MSSAPGVDTAVIFVHGFAGDAVKTWLNFQGLADAYPQQYPWWAAADMFFYSYDSIRTPIRRNARLLGNFVEAVWQRTWWGSDPSQNPQYKDLIFAGHSEGGVIIRRLILDRYQNIKQSVKLANPSLDENALKATIATALNNDFILAASLRLFAPACMGINFSATYGFITEFSALVKAITTTSIAKNELLHTSPVLAVLRAGTEQAYAESPQIRSLYTRPTFGVPDEVVYSDSYQGEEPLWDKGYNHPHVNVCKPTYLHLRPLEFVRK
jgi:hypothetical protein